MIRDLSITEVSRPQASSISASQHLIDLIVILTQGDQGPLQEQLAGICLVSG